MTLLILASALLTANAMLYVIVRQQRIQLMALQEATQQLLRHATEVEAKRVELIEKQRVAEQLIDHGSIGVETVHKAIAGLTFGILEAVPTTSSASRNVREAHDLIAGETYEAVRKLNRQVGKFIKDTMNPDR